MIRLKALRVEKQWTQAALAQKLRTTQQTIARYETGEREPDFATINRMCDLFNCTADYLLGRSPIKSFDISQEEYRIIEIYRSMNPDGRAYALQSLDMASRLYPEKNHDVSDMEAAQ